MIRIVSGPFGSGKTTRLAALYGELSCGDGVIFSRVLEGGRTTGYRVRHLASGEERPFAADVASLPADWDACAECGRFSFSAAGFAFAAGVLDSLLTEGVSPVWLDEVGPWELSGGGFAPQLEALAHSGVDLLLGVRPSCVEAVVARFFGAQRERVKVETLPESTPDAE